MTLSVAPIANFAHLVVGVLKDNPSIGWLEIARPSRLNSFDTDLWRDFPKAVKALNEEDGVKVVVLSGQGKMFCAGIDVQYLAGMLKQLQGQSCPGRMREAFRHNILQLQEAFTALEHCRWPVIAAVHGACIGGGIDMITACDVRVCSEHATFCVKEVDLAITADLGTLQRLPKIVGYGAAMDLALSGRTIDSREALRLGLVTQVLGVGREELLQHVIQLAAQLARKSPLALLGTKRVLLHARDHSVKDGLDYVATWNSAMLLSTDLTAAVQAVQERRQPVFSKL